jgi:hypothetical protein
MLHCLAAQIAWQEPLAKPDRGFQPFEIASPSRSSGRQAQGLGANVSQRFFKYPRKGIDKA